ncbi:alpha-L-fucosidase [Paenibacillus alkaliterrae]|uniref:alpha-L-fucosidase n=1 Tax=Paenibacillus alkaliterrae TaxID=320909 RepID=UPI001F183C38|nr:alpha-L-fucosidase [Paenibacillus alkaliterrae]MCF2938018.1 alpha-L-fucosidase [Paenibacillus alkaliterrae]
MVQNDAVRSLPTKQQLEWADAEIGVIIHFDVQVFEPGYSDWRQHWGYTPSPKVFNPAALDTDQWIRTAKAAGAKYAVLVAKHCSGFSLWPTEAHDYSVKSSPWRDGQGDIVRDFVRSCEKYDVRPGLYYSTSANAYYRVDNPGIVVSGHPAEQEAYNAAVIRQATELWSNYGELFEIWFDGGTLPPEQGGPDVVSLLAKLQPEAVCFQGPRGTPSLIRWVGNEEGCAPYPCWSTTDEMKAASDHGASPMYGSGNPDGAVWAPAEADVPNRRDQWFWYEGEEHLLHPVDKLVECYCDSVGRNANLLLGMVIDNRGLVPEADVKQFTEFGEAIKRRFGNIRGETAGQGHELILYMSSPSMVNQLVIMEELSEGERIRGYRIDGLADGVWKPLCEGISVGHKRIERIDPVRVSQIRLTVTRSSGTPRIRTFAAFETGSDDR